MIDRWTIALVIAGVLVVYGLLQVSGVLTPDTARSAGEATGTVLARHLPYLIVGFFVVVFFVLVFIRRP